MSSKDGDIVLRAKQVCSVMAVGQDYFTFVMLPGEGIGSNVLNNRPSVAFYNNILSKSATQFKFDVGNFIANNIFEFYNGPTSIQEGIVKISKS